MDSPHSEGQALLPQHVKNAAPHYDSVRPTLRDKGRSSSSFWSRKLLFMVLTVIAIVAALSSIAYALAVPRLHHPHRYNNGTHEFNPTVILISLDGVVNHDLDLAITPHMSDLANTGVRARWMVPSFPPITFPNHWSLVTGLYPEAHGIVSNHFYDEKLNDTFHYKTPAMSWDAKWWGGEPIWNTAERQHKKTGVIMWPGCSTIFQNNMHPSLIAPFNDSVPADDKIDLALSWLDLPLEERPQFIALYIQQVDQAGHAFGPYAKETMNKLRLADASVGRLLDGLKERHLTDIVNTIVVSDHGMSQTDKSKLIYYDDILTKDELALIWQVEADPILAIRPHPGANETEVVERLYQAFKRLHDHLEEPHFEVYKREDFPKRFHYSHQARIPPLLILPDPGWSLVTHAQFDPDRDSVYHPMGKHGYDNLSPESHAIFVARGPLFPQHAVIKPFWNVELHSVLARILDIQPSQNNGTLNGLLPLEAPSS